MADVNAARRALINYSTVQGDTFSPPALNFIIDGDPEDFSGSTLKMQIRTLRGGLIKELTDEDGITVTDNSLQYLVNAEDMEDLFRPGAYCYDVEKTTGDLVETIQYGRIMILNEVTR